MSGDTVSLPPATRADVWESAIDAYSEVARARALESLRQGCGVNSYYSGLNESMTARNATAFGQALSGPFFLLALELWAAVEIALAFVTPLDFGPSFLLSIIVGLLIAGVLEATLFSGALKASSVVTSVGSGMVRDFQGWVNGTYASADFRLPTRYNQLASMSFIVAAFAVLLISIGLLGNDLGVLGSGVRNPVLPIVAFAFAMIAIGLHLAILLGNISLKQLPYPFILAGILAGVSLVLSARVLPGREDGPWKTMAELDVVIGAVGLGVTIYEILSDII